MFYSIIMCEWLFSRFQFGSFSLLLFFVALACANSATGAEVDFQREVRPILAEHCFVCHGVDAATRQANLRLDQRADALKGGKSGKAAIVPGQPEQGELPRRISAHDAGTVMPPPKQKKPLSAKEIDTLKKW